MAHAKNEHSPTRWLAYIAIGGLLLGLSGVYASMGCSPKRSTQTCFQAQDCQTGQQCKNNRCVAACGSNQDCPGGTYCDLGTLLCKSGTLPNPNDQRCGDGNLGLGEECDGTDLNGQNCQSKGFAGGMLTCTPTCTFDTSSCLQHSLCGNNFIDQNEECDGTNLDNQTCQTKGFASGTLSCDANCKLVTSACKSAPISSCGNGIIEKGEDCDSTNLNNQTCQTKGYASGTLLCTSKCTFNLSGCKQAPTTCTPTCTGNKVCDTKRLVCVDCLSNADCGGKTCLNNKCVACTKDADCPNGVCQNNACVQCRSNAQCTSATSSRCASGTCAACASDADCSHIAGLPECKSGTCQKKFSCEDWDNDRKAPCPNGTKNCDCSGGCGTATSCGGGTGTPKSGCYTVQNTSARTGVPASSNGHGSGSFLWKPVSDSNGKLVVLFPSHLPAKKGWIQTPNGAKEFSQRHTISNPDRHTHFFSKPGSAYPNNSKACWSN